MILVPWILRPLLMLLALGLSSALVGTLINLRRAEFSAEALSHAVFPGIVIGFIVAGLDGIVPGGAVAGAIAAAVLTVAGNRAGKADEAGIAITLSTFYAAGVVISLAHSDKSGQLEALMFGRLLEMSTPRLMQGVIACALAAVLVAAYWPAQVALAFDRRGASAAGVPTLRQDAFFNAAVAAVVVAGAAAVGVLLVIGFLVIPAAGARLVSSSPRTMGVWAVVLATISSLVGMWVVSQPLSHPVSPQACVVVALLGGFLIAAAAGAVVRR
ncbi:metal ABC transporter permease [Corynebacterium sp. LK2510]|uniref:metal ABC transporter permease n=1 Tax=Corynebacterium sp. LK2510 TaxID=3110472 RepID=UPI0034CF2116